LRKKIIFPKKKLEIFDKKMAKKWEEINLTELRENHIGAEQPKGLTPILGGKGASVQVRGNFICDLF